MPDPSHHDLPTIRPHHPVARELSEMCAVFGIAVPEELELDGIEVSGLASAAHRVEEGDLFVAVEGGRGHGADLVDVALDRGAVAIVTDAEGAARIRSAGSESDVPVIVVDEPGLAVGHLAGWLLRSDEAWLKLFAVAGDARRTQVAERIEELLDLLGEETALSTSRERRVADEAIPADGADLDADELHALIGRMRETRVRAGIIELSPAGIAAHRADGVEFDVACLLGGAGTPEELAALEEFSSPDFAVRGIIDLYDPSGTDLLEAARIPMTTFSARPGGRADWTLTVSHEEDRSHFVVAGPESRKIHSTVYGASDASLADLAFAIVALEVAGWDLEQVQEALDRVGGLQAVEVQESCVGFRARNDSREAGW